MLDASYYQKTDEIIAMHTREERSLIPIIQDIQEEYRYLPPELLTYVAKQIGITEAKAYSVASFYENFSFEPKGKYLIKVCDGTACHVRFLPRSLLLPLYDLLSVLLTFHKSCLIQFQFPFTYQPWCRCIRLWRRQRTDGIH